MKTFAIAVFFASVATLANAQQTRWSASANTAVPHFGAAGAQNLQTWSDGHGRGLRPANVFVGETYAYLPVTAAHGMTFKTLCLRAEDNSIDGAARAEFVRQPRQGNPGPAVTMAAVVTDNVVMPADGFQFKCVDFPAHTLDLNFFSYSVRLTLARSALAANPTALDVSLMTP